MEWTSPAYQTSGFLQPKNWAKPSYFTGQLKDTPWIRMIPIINQQPSELNFKSNTSHKNSQSIPPKPLEIYMQLIDILPFYQVFFFYKAIFLRQLSAQQKSKSGWEGGSYESKTQANSAWRGGAVRARGLGTAFVVGEVGKIHILYEGLDEIGDVTCHKKHHFRLFSNAFFLSRWFLPQITLRSSLVKCEISRDDCMIWVLWAYSTVNPPLSQGKPLETWCWAALWGMGEVGLPPEATRMTNMSNVDFTYPFSAELGDGQLEVWV